MIIIIPISKSLNIKSVESATPDRVNNSNNKLMNDYFSIISVSYALLNLFQRKSQKPQPTLLYST